MPGILSADGNRHGTVEDTITIGFARGIVAGVKVRIDLFAQSDDNGIRQETVERFLDNGFVQPGITSKIGDLAESMNTGIRPA